MKTKLKMLLVAIGLLILTASSFVATSSTNEKIIWHQSVKKGLKIGWGLVELEPYFDGAFTIGEEELTAGDLIGIIITDDPATDLTTLYQSTGDPSSYIAVYLNNKKLDQPQVQALLNFFPLSVSVLPVGYEQNDGTVLDLITLLSMMQTTNTAFIDGEYLVMQVPTPSGNVWSKNHRDSGIAYEFSADLTGRGFYRGIFTTEASNVDITGNPINKNDSTAPGFDFIQLFVGFGIWSIGSIAIVRRRAR
ncbi:MAG: hypothetical protein ACFFB3_00230 [Candidatus Hodarchaeota archaeon]